MVNIIYGTLVTDAEWVYCLGPHADLRPSQYFSFIGACPRCVAKGYYVAAPSHKPASAAIGDASALSLVLILRQVLARISGDYELVATTKRQGDIDVIIYGPDLITLAEVKASPLVSYPLEVVLTEQLTREDPQTGETVTYYHHEKTTRVVADAPTIYLYLPHRDLRIDLGPKRSAGWPYEQIIKWVQDTCNVKEIVKAWVELYDLYVRRDREKPAFFLIHGCGSRNQINISDSKNASGLDRTDDIKKGTYQVLKYGAYYGLASERRNVKTALLSNVHTVVHFEEYLKELENIVWTKENLLSNTSPDKVQAYKKDIFYLYDGIVCFTKNFFNNDILARLFDWEEFGRRLAKEGTV